jgi:hypothetical protein
MVNVTTTGRGAPADARGSARADEGRRAAGPDDAVGRETAGSTEESAAGTAEGRALAPGARPVVAGPAVSATEAATQVIPPATDHVLAALVALAAQAGRHSVPPGAAGVVADRAVVAAEAGHAVTSGTDHRVAPPTAQDRPVAPRADRVVAGPQTPAAAGDHVVAPGRDFVVLADRDDATVVRVGGAVAKAHPRETEVEALGIRLRVAGHPSVRGVLLAPYGDGAPGVVEGRPVTVWPYGVPVDPSRPAAAPWEAAATLLARLHAVAPEDLPGPVPPMRGPAKAAAALARMRDVPDRAAARTVREAWSRLPGWARDEGPYDGPFEGSPALCHGDWHLGQLVRRPEPHRGPHPGPHSSTSPGGWLLIDVDDLGLGDPAWDLARPAMWFGAGLLAPEVWARFLGAYRAAGGQGVPAAGDPWERLDVPARALAVQSAAIAVAKAARDGRDLDEAESELVAACARIAQLQ